MLEIIKSEKPVADFNLGDITKNSVGDLYLIVQFEDLTFGAVCLKNFKALTSDIKSIEEMRETWNTLRVVKSTLTVGI